MTPTPSPQHGPSFRGIFAGSLMGLLVVMIMAALALVLSAFLPFDIKATSIAAGLYATLTSVLSALVGGYFCVRGARVPLVVNERGKYEPEDTSLTTLLTAAAIVVLTTLLTLSSATSVLTTASHTVSRTLPEVEATLLAALTESQLPETLEATGDDIRKPVPQNVLIEAEETARQAALFSGSFWLLNAFLTFVISFLGSRLALLTYRIDSPLSHLTEDDL